MRLRMYLRLVLLGLLMDDVAAEVERGRRQAMGWMAGLGVSATLISSCSAPLAINTLQDPVERSGLHCIDVLTDLYRRGALLVPVLLALCCCQSPP